MTLDPRYRTNRSAKKQQERNTNKTTTVRYESGDYEAQEEEKPVRRNVHKQSAKKPKKQKRQLGSGLFWVILLVCSVFFVFSFWKLQIFSLKIHLIGTAAVALILLITHAGTSFFDPRNAFQKFVNITLSIAMLIGAIGLPYVQDRISDVIDKISGNQVRISMYALTEEYKDAHAESFVNTIEVPDPGKTIKPENYADAVYGSFMTVDKTNQEYAFGKLEDMLGGSLEYHYDYNSARQCAEALYANKIDIILMSESYASLIEDTEGFETFSQDTQILYTFTRTIENDLLVKKDSSLTKQPFTIFFGGNDDEGELSLEGRTDVDMIVSVNPSTGQIAIINMPRDSFIPNPYLDWEGDKLTHLGLYDLSNTLEGLEDYLDVSIDYYVLVNFTTFMKIIEAIGGVDVDNPYAFDYTWDDYSYPEGTIHLDGQAALYYVRERYNLPDGDFGRSEHQQIVMKAIIKKLCSPALLANFNDLMNAIDGTFLSNLSSGSLYGLCQKQLDEGTEWNIVNYHVEGSFGYEVTASDPYNELSVVYPYDNQVEFVKDIIDQVYAGEILTGEDMPEGYDY